MQMDMLTSHLSCLLHGQLISHKPSSPPGNLPNSPDLTFFLLVSLPVNTVMWSIDISQGVSLLSLLTSLAPSVQWDSILFPFHAGSSSEFSLHISPSLSIFQHCGLPQSPFPGLIFGPSLHCFSSHSQRENKTEWKEVPGFLSPSGPQALPFPQAALAGRAGRWSVSTAWGWRH